MRQMRQVILVLLQARDAINEAIVNNLKKTLVCEPLFPLKSTPFY